MLVDKIEKLLERCESKDLERIIATATKLRDKAEIGTDPLREDDSPTQRTEPRFETNLLATLTRITDIRPGERKEFSVTIRNISRSGMKLIVDPNFVPSRLVEVTFAAPAGKLKRATLEIVRMRKMTNDEGSWVEVGCRSVGEEHARRLRLQEQKIAKMRGKLHKKTGILVLVVGPDVPEVLQIIARVKAASYQVRHVTGIRQAMQSASRTGAQLAILCKASNIAHEDELRAELLQAPHNLAMLALVDSEEDRFPLLDVGVDETLRIGPETKDDFLLYSMERALVSHAVRRDENHGPTAMALILSLDRTKINLMSYQLEEHGYGSKAISDAKEALHFSCDDFDVVFADFDGLTAQEFQQLVRHFGGIPVIALCDEIGYGHEAISYGATNYLCMPPGRDEMRMILAALNSASSPLA